MSDASELDVNVANFVYYVKTRMINLGEEVGLGFVVLRGWVVKFILQLWKKIDWNLVHVSWCSGSTVFLAPVARRWSPSSVGIGY